MLNTPKYNSWAGYCFEGICLKHINQIIKGLGLSAIMTSASQWSYYPKTDDDGAQIDIVIDRADGCINLIELKLYNSIFRISKEYAEKLRRKKEIFREQTQTKKSLFTTFISVYGVIEDANYFSSVDNQLTLDTLFNC